MASETETAPVVKNETENLIAPSENDLVTEKREESIPNDEIRSLSLEPPKKENVGQGDAENEGTTIANTVPMVNMEGVPKQFLVKHPLQYRWVLWYCKQDRNKKWEDCLKQVATFDTVEDFWALYNHIQLASGLSWGSDYYMFKEGIQPMWEDPHNVEGGRWLIQVDKNRRNELLDHYWLELLMAVIGEQFDDNGEYICGLVINVRQKGDKVSLWTSDATKEEENRRIGQIIKQKLGIADVTINYEQHKDTESKTSSNVKPRLRI